MAKRRLPENEENIPNTGHSGSPSEGEDESEDLFGKNYMDDYRSDSELDTYDATDTEEEPMSYEEMQRIEHEVIQQERSLLQQEHEVDNMDVTETGITEEFLEKEFYAKKIVDFFVGFLNNAASKKYVKLIKRMCSENEESLYVSYMDLERENEAVIKLLLKNAEDVIKLLDKGLEAAVHMQFPHYSLIKPRLHVRLVDLPVLESIRNLRNTHLNTLVRVNGIVTRRSCVLSLLSIVKFSCTKCSAVFGPFAVETDDFRPASCFECQSRGPFFVNSSETLYKDHQKLVLQEIPGTVPPGNLPRSKEIVCYFDLIDKAKPGDEVEVVGIYKNIFSLSLNVRNGFPVFSTVIEAVTIINREEEFSTLKITEDDIREIRNISKRPNILEMIFSSIAPSIFGFRDVKRALSLGLFGGERKAVKDHTIRGDINVLLLGDPGTAKSQFLRCVQGLMHKAVLATGQGTSSVGLTASVLRDQVTKEWTLEGGALVLADRGICLIDEFDKMNDVDRTSIHEAMEQQTVSISKAGIVTSLNARCGVIAAANPVRGRYNTALTFSQNVNLSDPIITRFDILCVVRDVVDVQVDEKMASFVLENHYKSTEKGDSVSESCKEEGMIDQELLRKYIVYARTNVHPIVKEVDLEKISQLYSELREESFSAGSVPITVRHIESIVRMSEAFARMRLSPVVSSNDIDEAIHVALSSFIGAQKYSITKSLRRRFSRFLVKNDGEDVIFYILSEIFNEKMRWKGSAHLYVSQHEFENVVRSHGFVVSSGFYTLDRFQSSGYLLDAGKIFRSA
eukprot:jgi/Antlo1/1824/957